MSFVQDPPGSHIGNRNSTHGRSFASSSSERSRSGTGFVGSVGSGGVVEDVSMATTSGASYYFSQPDSPSPSAASATTTTATTVPAIPHPSSPVRAKTVPTSLPSMKQQRESREQSIALLSANNYASSPGGTGAADNGPYLSSYKKDPVSARSVKSSQTKQKNDDAFVFSETVIAENYNYKDARQTIETLPSASLSSSRQTKGRDPSVISTTYSANDNDIGDEKAYAGSITINAAAGSSTMNMSIVADGSSLGSYRLPSASPSTSAIFIDEPDERSFLSVAPPQWNSGNGAGGGLDDLDRSVAVAHTIGRGGYQQPFPTSSGLDALDQSIAVAHTIGRSGGNNRHEPADKNDPLAMPTTYTETSLQDPPSPPTNRIRPVEQQPFKTLSDSSLVAPTKNANPSKSKLHQTGRAASSGRLPKGNVPLPRLHKTPQEAKTSNTTKGATSEMEEYPALVSRDPMATSSTSADRDDATHVTSASTVAARHNLEQMIAMGGSGRVEFILEEDESRFDDEENPSSHRIMYANENDDANMSHQLGMPVGDKHGSAMAPNSGSGAAATMASCWKRQTLLWMVLAVLLVATSIGVTLIVVFSLQDGNGTTSNRDDMSRPGPQPQTSSNAGSSGGGYNGNPTTTSTAMAPAPSPAPSQRGGPPNGGSPPAGGNLFSPAPMTSVPTQPLPPPDSDLTPMPTEIGAPTTPPPTPLAPPTADPTPFQKGQVDPGAKLPDPVSTNAPSMVPITFAPVITATPTVPPGGALFTPPPSTPTTSSPTIPIIPPETSPPTTILSTLGPMTPVPTPLPTTPGPTPTPVPSTLDPTTLLPSTSTPIPGP